MEELTNAEAQELSPKISVIIPVYRPGDGLRSCIGSLRNQTLSDIEMIFVDDCGGDDAFSIVEAESAEDDRIRIIKNAQNLGAGPSRNRGMEEACGEYLSFVDADDWVAPNFYELLYAQALKTGADIVKGSRSEVGESGNPADGQSGALLNARIRQSLLAGNPLWRSFTYEHQSAIYRREAVLSSGARYGSSRVGQDVTFLLRYCSSGPSIAFVDKAAYYYVARGGSAVRTYSRERLGYRLDALREQINSIIERELYITQPETVAAYVSRSSRHLISMGFRISRSIDDRSAGEAFFREIRSQILRIPGIESRKFDSPTLLALVDYGIPLALTPHSPVGELPYAQDWPPIVAEWLRYVDSVTGSKRRAASDTAPVIGDSLISLASRKGIASSAADCQKAMEEIRGELVRCNSRKAIYLKDPCLVLFAAGTSPTCLAVKRRAKGFVKRLLRIS